MNSASLFSGVKPFTARGLSVIGFLSMTAFVVASSAAAHASCYGSGHLRMCDGIGGPGATYTPTDKNGTTVYHGPGGRVKSVSRQDASIGDLQIRVLRLPDLEPVKEDQARMLQGAAVDASQRGPALLSGAL
jgi:hypothetical protein